MSNPYEDIFNEQPAENSSDEAKKPDQKRYFLPDDDRFATPGPEALDQVLADIEIFNQKATVFSRTLSDLGVNDHKVTNPTVRLFINSEDQHDQGSLAGERTYYELQTTKFRKIIEPMQELGQLHLETLHRLVDEVDEYYHSAEKSDGQIKADKQTARNGINLQRQILNDAAENLNILAAGLKDTERRIGQYINAGGRNNISKSEFVLLQQSREALVDGKEHDFNYHFFNVNLIDKTMRSMGIFVAETSARYLAGLGDALQGKHS